MPRESADGKTQSDEHDGNVQTASPLRSRLARGMLVLVVLKQDQRTGRLTRGVVQDILTRSASHPHGIKVRLVSGQVGRVQQIVEAEPPGSERV